jgi:hypothetical protein
MKMGKEEEVFRTMLLWGNRLIIRRKWKAADLVFHQILWELNMECHQQTRLKITHILIGINNSNWYLILNNFNLCHSSHLQYTILYTNQTSKILYIFNQLFIVLKWIRKIRAQENSLLTKWTQQNKII